MRGGGAQEDQTSEEGQPPESRRQITFAYGQSWFPSSTLRLHFLFLRFRGSDMARYFRPATLRRIVPLTSSFAMQFSDLVQRQIWHTWIYLIKPSLTRHAIGALTLVIPAGNAD